MSRIAMLADCVSGSKRLCGLALLVACLPAWLPTAPALAVPATPAIAAGASEPLAGTSGTAQARFGFADGVVRVASSGDVAGTIMFTAGPLDRAQLEAALQTLVDLPTAGSEATAVSFFPDKAIELQRQPAARSWMVPFAAKGLPIGAHQTRLAQAQLGDRKTAFAYVLSNRPATPIDFGVTFRPLWVVTPRERASALLVESREQPISGLRIALSTLSEQNVGTAIEVQALELCPEPIGDCQPIGVQPPQSSRTLFLRMKADHLPAGLFKGSLSLAVDGRPEPKPVTFDIASTNPNLGLLGCIAILLGVVAAWFVNVRARLVVARLAMLQVATAVREKLDEMDASVARFDTLTGGSMSSLRGLLARRSRELEESELDKAGRLPSEFAFYRAFDEAPLRTFLGQAEAATKALAVLVREGVEVLEHRWIVDARPAARAAIQTAVGLLDVPNVADEAAARALVDAAIQVLLPLPVAPAFALVRDGRPVPPLTAREAGERIAQRIELTNMSAWFLYLLLVALGGIVLLVLRSQSFGTWLDFVFCFFWGFGLPTTLDKLQPLTPSSVASTLSVTLPK